jgi:hypothetical protein
VSIRLDDETLTTQTAGSVVSGATVLPVTAGRHTVRVAANSGAAGVLWVEVAPVESTPAEVA